MPDATFHTALLQGLLGRLRAGDQSAADELIRATQSRLDDLARRMLRSFPNVARWADADDLFQGAAVRLLRALDSADVADTRHFLNLAAAVMRRELIDLARHFQGPEGVGANHASVAPGATGTPPVDPPAHADAPDELDRWAALHVAAENLPVEQREVFGLRFYHRWDEARIAELFCVDERTVRRRWRAACAALGAALGDKLPDTGPPD